MSALLLVTLTLLSSMTPAQPQPSATMPYVKESRVNIDGKVSDGEYAASYKDSLSGVSVYWQHDDSKMWISLESPGTGWVAMGFGPVGVGMDGANLIIGYVEDSSGKVFLSDQLGVGFDHLPDTERGGNDDIIEKAGVQVGGRTILEFAYPLVTNDPNDFNLLAGGIYGFILAYNADRDDLVTMHTAYSPSLTFLIAKEEAVTTTTNANTTQPRGKNTVLSLEIPPQSTVQGKGYAAYATLLDVDSDPVVSAPIVFVSNSTFGLERVGEATTNQTGVATIRLFKELEGTYLLEALFSGSSTYSASRAAVYLLISLERDTHGIEHDHLVVSIYQGLGVEIRSHLHRILSSGQETHEHEVESLGESTPHNHVLITLVGEDQQGEGFFVVLTVIGLVIGSVWLTYGYTALQLLRIWRARRQQRDV